MEGKDAPPPYSGVAMENPVAGAPPNYGSQPQTNYGYSGHPQQAAYPPAHQAANPPAHQAAYPPAHQYPYGGQQQQQQQQQQQMSNVVVTQVGAGGGMMYQAAPVDYTTQAFIACLCCFWPTGIVAIMKASESRDALSRGDIAGAHAAANSARQMVRISYIVGIVGIVFAAVLLGIYFSVIVNSYTYNY